jgi:hypothetical protein
MIKLTTLDGTPIWVHGYHVIALAVGERDRWVQADVETSQFVAERYTIIYTAGPGVTFMVKETPEYIAPRVEFGTDLLEV